MINLFDIDRMRDLFDLKDGQLFWKARKRKGKHIGQPAGHLNNDGYIHVKVGDRDYLAHRIIFALIHGRHANGPIDHANLIKTDNSEANLREATLSQNGHNQPRTKMNTSGVKGVCYDKRYGTWYARIMLNKKSKYLGSFKDIELAALAYESAARRYFGEFARPDTATSGEGGG